MLQTLTASLENYLEAILADVRKEGHAHATEIAKRLDVSKASVTGALRKLADRKLINYKPYGVITFTEAGREAAEKVRARHDLLKRFLTEILGIETGVAEENACRMEHAMSQDVLDRMATYVEFVESCPVQACTWQSDEGAFCGKQAQKTSCQRRLQATRTHMRESPEE